MAELKPLYFTNISARSITVEGVAVPPKGVGVVSDENHKGVVAALKAKQIEKTSQKEYEAYTDPAAVKEAAEKAAAEKAANEKKTPEK